MTSRIGATLALVIAAGLCILSDLRAQTGTNLNPGVPWPATDALGRALPMADTVGPSRADRAVAIFYFLWHNNPHGKKPYGDGPYDVAKILAADSAALAKPDSPLWGKVGMYHYWGEPLYGYYQSTDPWVLRRHAHLLADAGIDTLIFDTTNAVTYPEVYRRLCEVFAQVRAEGDRTPQIAFMVNTQAGPTAEKIYEDLYKPGLHRELWFQWQGKPLMICDPKEASDELRRFFTLRRAHWPFEMVNTPYAWHWEATYPQPYGFTDDPQQPEQVNVSVAQNLRQSDGRVTNMSEGDARGRSFHQGRTDRTPGAVNWGRNFQEQWQRAFDLQPPIVMVTGWNEWIAGRWSRPGQPIVFVDQYDQEHSRDIEPMQGGHGDNYYWQLVANVRRYKGAPPVEKASTPVTIDIKGDFTGWAAVRPEYRDHLGETIARDHAGAGGTHYVAPGGANDLEAMKVARDAEHVYFYLSTRQPIAAAETWLLIDSDRNRTTGWEGYDFIAGREVEPDGRVWLEKHAGGWQWEKVVPLDRRAGGRELHLAIPRTGLGLPPGVAAIALDFKWIDSARKPGDILDVYLSGDAAPEGRWAYRYEAE